ncbi:MAG: RluA family pseudouridine synthase [Candidatus Gracilibacteria bacterium]|nr:RluA family pseudouridine synthase [Candidatus Gracilibacteria bacterium]
MKYNFSIIIEKKMRVDMYLSALFSDYSRSYIQKLIDNNHLKINGKILNKNKKISNGDEVELEIVVEKSNVEAENIPLDIVYEDENIVIINKDAGMNTHIVSGEEGKTGTLVNALLYHCTLASIGGVERPGIVHRLDKDTSGLIMVAKNDKMMQYLQKIIKNREVDKYYIAIVAGKLSEEKFTIKSLIGRDPNSRIKMTTKNPINPKQAITHGEIIGHIGDDFTIVKLKLETGRTHQIRVHLASIGYPIIGDKVYGSNKINKKVLEKYGLNRQALHAYELGFNLFGKEKYFKGELKSDMKKIIGNIL